MKDMPTSPEAMSRWGAIPEEARQRILANTWCPHCLTETSMKLESLEMKGDCILLGGTCPRCGKPVARIVVPEE
jgi:hypothetical protein